MRKRLFMAVMVACLFLVGCTEKKEPVVVVDSSTVPEEKDSTIYGVCGDGTSMNSIQLVTGQGDTLIFMKDVEALEDPVKGGMAVGDNLALMPGKRVDGEDMVRNVINLTSLLGKWTSLDKNFEIKDDGAVASSVSAESNQWHSWKIFNGKLLLGRDTFNVYELTADSLYLENDKGIFTYKRQY